MKIGDPQIFNQNDGGQRSSPRIILGDREEIAMHHFATDLRFLADADLSARSDRAADRVEHTSVPELTEVKV